MYNVTLTAWNDDMSGSTTKVNFIDVRSSAGGGGGGGGSGGGSGGFFAPSGATTTATPTPTPTPTTPGIPPGPGGILPLNSALALSQSVVIVSEDGMGSISMPNGMRPQDSSGAPLLTLSIRRIPNADVPTTPAAGFSFAGYAYEIEPTGATFDPYVTFAITIPENEWAGLQGRDLSIKWYNTATSAWEDIPTTVSSETRTVSAKITHTSIFALFVASPPPTIPPAAVTTIETTPAAPIVGGLPLDLIIKIIILVIIIIAAVVVILYFLRKRKGGPEAPTTAETPADEWDIKGLQ